MDCENTSSHTVTHNIFQRFRNRPSAIIFVSLAAIVLSGLTANAYTHYRRTYGRTNQGVKTLGGNIKCEYCSNKLSAKEHTQTHNGEEQLIFPRKSFACGRHWCTTHNQPRPDGKECAMCKLEKRREEAKAEAQKTAPKKPLNGFLGVKFGDIACEEAGYRDFVSELFGMHSSSIATSASFKPKKRFRTYSIYRVHFLPLSKRIYKIECSYQQPWPEGLTTDQERDIQKTMIEKRYEGKMQCDAYKNAIMKFPGSGILGRKVIINVGGSISAVDLDLQAQLDDEIAEIRKLRKAKAESKIRQQDIDAL